MIKKGSKRVMITCTERTLEGLEYLQDFYDITASELIKMLVAKEYQERKLH